MQYYTRISNNNMEQILSADKTPAEIIAFLEEGALYRSFADVLRAAYPGDDLGERLKENLLKDPETKEKSLNKSIQNWLNGSNMPQNREQLFKICFALQLTEDASNKVLARASDTGIHYRNPKELVYAYSLRMKLTYQEACLLNERMEKIYGPVVEKVAAERNCQWQEKEKNFREQRKKRMNELRKKKEKYTLYDSYVASFQDDEKTNFFTQGMKNVFSGIKNERELEEFFKENSKELGMIHESAYEKFWKLLINLEEPEVFDEDELDDSRYSIERVAETYFRMHVPNSRNVRDYSYLQKTIKKNWPGASELQKMKTRKTDVSRKAILLLFMITEDFMYSTDLEDASEDLGFFDGTEEDPFDELEVMISRIDQFLVMYGMNQLDPGNPFDCLFLYALAAQYKQDFISDNFSEALGILFRDV